MIRNNLYTKLAKGRHWIPRNRRYESVSAEVFDVKAKGSNWRIIVSPNYAWDGPSFLPIFYWKSNPWLKWSKLHDALFTSKQLHKVRVIKDGKVLEDGQWSFGDANEIFLEGLKSDGVALYKVFVAETLIRWFGKIYSDTY